MNFLSPRSQQTPMVGFNPFGRMRSRSQNNKSNSLRTTWSSSTAVAGALATRLSNSGVLKLACAGCLLLCLAPTACSQPGPPSMLGPDFTLTVSPGSLTITAGAAGSQVSVLATAVHSFSGTVAVTITGLPTGVTATPATLTLTPGKAQS